MSYTDFSLVESYQLAQGDWAARARVSIPAGSLLGHHGGQAVAIPVANNRISHGDIEHREIVQIALVGDLLLGLVEPRCLAWSGIDYINHSCQPNAAARDRTVIYALRDIEPGEELTMDYRLWDLVPEGIACWCENGTCQI